MGASQFNPSAPSHTIANVNYGVPATFVGDVNGDGYGRLLRNHAFTRLSSGLAPTIFFGGPDVSALTTLLLTKTAGGPFND